MDSASSLSNNPDPVDDRPGKADQADHASPAEGRGSISEGSPGMDQATGKQTLLCVPSSGMEAEAGESMPSPKGTPRIAPSGSTLLDSGQHGRARMDSEQPEGSAHPWLDLSFGSMEQPGPAGRRPGDLRASYFAAVERSSRVWDKPTARRRFDEFDRFRSVFFDELFKWLKGENPRKVHSLTAFAWSVTHDPINEGGTRTFCLDWSDRRQRVYLGDGLLEYLGTLKDEFEKLYSPTDESDQ